MYLMQSYDDALQQILKHGVPRSNKRTCKTRTIFGMSTRYRLDTGHFPIMTKRKIRPESVFAELLWFLSGSTNNDDLKRLGCKFWEPWVDSEFEEKHGYAPGSFGPVYGFQLRHFGGYYGNGGGGKAGSHFSCCVEGDGKDMYADPGQDMYGVGGFDQMAWVINRIKEDHSCRRTLWSLWNPSEVHKMRLPPCHMMAQVLVDDDRNLSLIMYQRSADFPIGVPANIQFYSALAIMIAQQTDCKPYEFIHMTGDSHIYEDQVAGVREYLEQPEVSSPKLEIKKAADIFSYQPSDFIISDFKPGRKIEIPVAV